MITPSNFYQSQNICSFNEAFGLTRPTANILLKEASCQKVGVIWSEILLQFSTNVARIVDQDSVIGTGQWIQKDMFITCAHVIPFKKRFITVINLNKQLLKLDVKKATIDEKRDFIIFRVSNPNTSAIYPKIAKAQDFTSQYAMIHFASDSNAPLVSIGHIDPDPHFNYKPAIDIDGGPGSSGAVLFNERGELAFLHTSRHSNFLNLRFNLPIEEVFSQSDFFETNVSYDEILEHGRFSSSLELKSDKLKYTKKIFNEAKNFVYEILKSKMEKFYAELFSSIGTILKGSLPSLRLDVQSHAKNYANIQLQYEDSSIAGILVSHDFRTCEVSEIPTICKYLLGNLINCITEAERTKQLTIAQIDLKKTNSFNM